MKTYKEIKITTVPFDVETVTGMLWQLDIDGINEFDDYITVFISESKNTSREDVEGILQQLVNENFIESFQTENTRPNQISLLLRLIPKCLLEQENTQQQNLFFNILRNMLSAENRF